MAPTIKKDLRLTSGNLWSDLTDHLPNYFLILNEHENTTPIRPYVRLFSDKNIAEFRHKLSSLLLNGTLYINIVILMMAIIILRIKLESVSIQVLDLLNCPENALEIKTG